MQHVMAVGQIEKKNETRNEAYEERLSSLQSEDENALHTGAG
jgi:hypothetical protein